MRRQAVYFTMRQGKFPKKFSQLISFCESKMAELFWSVADFFWIFLFHEILSLYVYKRVTERGLSF